MKYGHEMKVGLLAIASIVLFIVGVSYLQGSNLVSQDPVYWLSYNRVDNLQPGGRVLLNGYTVGYVEAVEMVPETGKINVAWALTEPLRITQDTKCEIQSLDIFGNMGVVLTLGKGAKAEDGDTLVPSVKVGMMAQAEDLIMPLSSKIEKLLAQLNTTMGYVNETLAGKENRVNNIAGALEKDLPPILANTKRATRSLTSLMDSLDGVLAENRADLSAITSNTADLTDSLKQISPDLKRLLSSTEKTLNELSTTLDKVNNGDGSIAKALNDPGIYDDANKAVASLDSLLTDMKARPGRYIHFSVFGKRDK